YSNPLADAYLYLSKDIIKLFMLYRADINGRDHTLGQLLFYIVKKGSKSLVECLLNKGAEINAQSLVFILIITYNKGYYNIVDCLIKRGANINA
ncbi:hypothetical protein V2W45_1236636, partial [Cenococcum geophilum]